MKAILFIFLFINYGFSQNVVNSKQLFTIGLNSQISSFKILKYTSYGSNEYEYLEDNDFGFNFLAEFNYQNRFLLSGINLGYMFDPIIPTDGFNTNLKLAFNGNYKSNTLESFIGPTFSLGYILVSSKKWDLNPSEQMLANIGVLYSRKYFNIEVGQMFRKRNYEIKLYNKFKYAFYISAGLHIPLKKEPKN